MNGWIILVVSVWIHGWNEKIMLLLQDKLCLRLNFLTLLWTMILFGSVFNHIFNESSTQYSYQVKAKLMSSELLACPCIHISNHHFCFLQYGTFWNHVPRLLFLIANDQQNLMGSLVNWKQLTLYQESSYPHVSFGIFCDEPTWPEQWDHILPYASLVHM